MFKGQIRPRVFLIRHKLCGHPFAGRYKALVVDGSGNDYLRTVCDYVHRQEITMSLKWIAQRLQMGSWTYVSNLLDEKSRTDT